MCERDMGRLRGKKKNEEQRNLSPNPLTNLSPTKQMKSVKPAEPC